MHISQAKPKQISETINYSKLLKTHALKIRTKNKAKEVYIEKIRNRNDNAKSCIHVRIYLHSPKKDKRLEYQLPECRITPLIHNDVGSNINV